MLTEDYFIRAINQLLAVLAKALGLKTAGMYVEALRMIDESYSEVLGIPSDVAHSLDDRELYQLINPGEMIDPLKLVAVAELSEMEGDLFDELKNSTEAERCYQRALFFYLECELSGLPSTVEPVQPALLNMVNRLGVKQIPPETLFTLYQYANQNKLYRLAEEAMLELLAKTGKPADLVSEIRSFYENLLQKEDPSLSAAGYTRADLAAQLQKWILL
jgi:hypothetical protein